MSPFNFLVSFLVVSLHLNYRYANRLKSPNLDDRRLNTEELNRRNAQQNDYEQVSIENDGMLNSNRSQSFCVNKPAQSEPNRKDSDDDDVSIAISDMKRPLSHGSTATTQSVQDDVNSPALDSRSKSAYSIGQSSIEEIRTGKSTTTVDNLDVESETIDTSLEHIQNENNEKLMAEEIKTVEATPMIVDGADAIDGPERTEEIIIHTQPEQLLDAPFVSISKPCEIDDNEPRSETDSFSLTSTEESSDYQAMREVALKTNPIVEKPLCKSLIPKPRPTIAARRNRIAPAKVCPINATPKTKTNEMFPMTLRKFDKPRDASNTCLSQLDSPTWEVTMNGLTTFVRLIRHHPDTVESNLHAYCVALSKQVKNLRSQVSRSACQASAEFFQTHAKHLETECEDLATQLFNRTADTNKFLRADAFRALAAMCDNLSPCKVIQTILTRGATHQNAIVRTATANLCSRIVSRLGADKIFSMNREYRDKLILAGANFLMEGSLDTRNNAKAFFKQLSIHPQYNRTLQDVIPQRIHRNIEKALRSIK